MPKKRPRPKLANCSPDHVRRLLRKLGGFYVHEGKKHTKATHTATGKMWTIPRHNALKRPYMRSLINDYLLELGYDEDEINQHLRC